MGILGKFFKFNLVLFLVVIFFNLLRDYFFKSIKFFRFFLFFCDKNIVNLYKYSLLYLFKR